MSPQSPADIYVAVDVGTGSVRAAAFSCSGARASATHVRPIRTRNKRPDHFEQSSADIWRAVVAAVRVTCADAAACAAAAAAAAMGRDAATQPPQPQPQSPSPPPPPPRVRAIGFDATCSLVAVNTETGAPISVVEEQLHQPVSPRIPPAPSPSLVRTRSASVASEGGPAAASLNAFREDVFDVVLWLDHRAIEETNQINNSDSLAVAAVRRHFGGKISPENEPGKLAHLKAKLQPDVWSSASFFDLADWLVYRCLGSDIGRSSCAAACKWGWGSGDKCEWNADFWKDIGLSDLADDGWRRIGSAIVPPGRCLGTICAERAAELTIDPTAVVASPMIDAHCGALGMLNPAPCTLLDQYAPNIHQRLAMICGTSTCHIALGRPGKPVFVPGVWGPFRDAVMAGYYATEGGQSTSGALVDHLVESHRAAHVLREEASLKGMSLYALLAEMTGGTREVEDLADPAADVHIFPDFHGNRSPRADPTLRGGIVGLTLATSQAQAGLELAVLFRACMQALAYGTRHIVEEMNRAGHSLRAVIACGGLCQNDLFLRELADACEMPVFCPTEPDSVLLGGAILAAAAASAEAEEIAALMRRMSRVDERRVFIPRESRRQFHRRKYEVFLAMCEDQIKYRNIMRGPGV